MASRELTRRRDEAPMGESCHLGPVAGPGCEAERLSGREVSEPIWEPDEWYGQCPPMEVIRADPVYL